MTFSWWLFLLPLSSSKVLGWCPDLHQAILSYIFHICGFICVEGMGFVPLVFNRVFKLDEESPDIYN